MASVFLSTPGCGEKPGGAVILISVDTLRQDHLSCYGYGRNTSPNLDRFAREEAVLFEAAYAQAPYTLPSHMSILTSLYPEAHGILYPVQDDGTSRRLRLPDSFITLAEVLKNRGFETSAFTDGLFVNSRYGFDQGFDEYRDHRNPDFEKNGFRKHRDELHRWIREHRERDFFLFIHTYDTHPPYVPPEPFKSRFRGAPPAQEFPPASLQFGSLLGAHSIQNLDQFDSLQDLIDLYDGSIAFVDEEIGSLFGLLHETGLWEKSLIVVTSDHGQSFMENGYSIGHGLGVTNEETLIPLLIKFPGSSHGGRRVSHVVESVDIMPTMLNALKIAPIKDSQGQNLLSGLNEEGWTKDYAYGVSPNTGNSHYFLQKGIKYIEAVNDPAGRLLKLHLKPINPPTCPKPENPYHVNDRGAFFYDFEKDPLGVAELFHRGDRAYELQETPYEWKATEVVDRSVLAGYKKAAYEIAARSAELGRKYREERVSEIELSPEDVEQLEALGYTAVVESASEGAGGHGLVEERSSHLILMPPLMDRTLLNRGDALAWEVSRRLLKQDPSTLSGGAAAKLDEAQAWYEKFRALHPEKENWIEWRLKFLDRARKHLRKPGTK